MEQEVLKKCIIEKYSENFEFCPFIGENYSKNRILVILESHYASSEIEPFDFTLELFSDNWKEKRSSKNTTINRLDEIFDGPLELRTDTCFHNYFQKTIVGDNKIKLLKKQEIEWKEIVKKSKKAFISLISEIEPKYIFCFSTEAYNYMPTKKDISDGLFDKICKINVPTKKTVNTGKFKKYTYIVNMKETSVINFTHPLNRQVKWSDQSKMIRKYINTLL